MFCEGIRRAGRRYVPFPEHLQHSKNAAREQPTAGLLSALPAEPAYSEMPRMEKMKAGTGKSCVALPVPASCCSIPQTPFAQILLTIENGVRIMKAKIF